MAGLYDPEMEQFQRQQAFGDALRKRALDTQGQMAGRVYVGKNPWQNFAEGAMGGYQSSSADAERQALMGRRDQQTQDWIGQRPSATTQQPTWTEEQMVAGPTQDAPLGQRDVTKPLRQQANEMQEWAIKGSGIRSPLAQSMAAQGMQHAMTMPEKQADREAAAEERRHQLGLTQAAQLQRDRERHQDKLEADEQHMRLVAASRPQRETPAAQVITTDQGIFTLGRDGTLKPLQHEGTGLTKTTGKGKGLGAADSKSLGQSNDLITRIDAALDQMDENPDAMGLKTLIPDIILQRTGESGERQTRAAIGEISAEKAHSLYGAAFTAAEQKRANQFLPASGDSPEAVRDKLIQLRKMADVAKTRIGGGDKAAPTDGEKTVVREVKLKDGRTGVEYSDGSRGFK